MLGANSRLVHLSGDIEQSKQLLKNIPVDQGGIFGQFVNNFYVTDRANLNTLFRPPGRVFYVLGASFQRNQYPDVTRDFCRGSFILSGNVAVGVHNPNIQHTCSTEVLCTTPHKKTLPFRRYRAKLLRQDAGLPSVHG